MRHNKMRTSCSTGFFTVCLTLFLVACNATGDSKPENTAMDVSRSFIRASLDGNFIQAKTLLSKDPKNEEYFNAYKNYYEKMSAGEKQSYRNASYEINAINDLNDSVSLVNYSNSYMKQPIELMVVKEEGLWKVDFKHTYQQAEPK